MPTCDMHGANINRTNLEPGDAWTKSMRCARTYPRRVERTPGEGEDVSLEYRWYTDFSVRQVDAMTQRITAIRETGRQSRTG